MVAGRWRDRPAIEADGLRLLEWLTSVELNGSPFSLSPVAGRAPGESRPGYDQQPIEAAAMADACAVAFELTGDITWAGHVVRAARWFLGRNDRGIPLLDPTTGGCADGLTAAGVNSNQGAQSTLASITELQQALRITSLPGYHDTGGFEHHDLADRGSAGRLARRAAG